MSQISLSEAIRNLRAELLAAMRADPGDALRFRLGPIEMELEVAVSREASAKGGFKWWLVEAGAEAKGGQVAKHKLKLVLEPIDAATGQRAEVANDLDRPT